MAFASAALFALVLIAPQPALAAGVSPSQSTPVQREQAQSRFLRGKEMLAKGNPEGALAEFNASLDIVSSPNTRLYVARCLHKMGNLVAAYVELGRTEIEARELARDDPRYGKAAQSAHEERAKLEPKLGFLIIEIAHARPDTTVKVGGDEIRRGGWSEAVPVMPGSTTVVVETAGRAPIERSLDVTAGGRVSVSIDADEGIITAPVSPEPPVTHPPAKPSAALRGAAYVTGGVAVVGLGVFAFFGLRSNATYDELEKACTGAACPAGYEERIAQGRSEQTAANVGLAVFAVGAAATVTLWVMNTSKSKSSSTAVSARVEASPSFVGVRGAF